MTPTETAALATLTARYGFRVSNLDAKRAGVSEHVLFSAVVAGRAKLERVHFVAGCDATVYLIFA